MHKTLNKCPSLLLKRKSFAYYMQLSKTRYYYPIILLHNHHFLFRDLKSVKKSTIEKLLTLKVLWLLLPKVL